MSNNDEKESATKQLLSTEINIATRPLHTKLNRLILTRLPLCLPPHAASPTIYATGLEHFAHIFLTFESLFHDITTQTTVNNPALSALLEDPWVHVPLAEDIPPSSPPTPISDHDVEVQHFLASLLPRGLPRSKRLLKDLAFLKKEHLANLSASLARFPGVSVHKFASHIRREASTKPHILFAYAWCFYMAVFSGGRHIRRELVNAGKTFWQGSDSAAEDLSDTESGLAFFNFDGVEDGEEIKAEFKQRLNAAENILSAEEREDVIEEAKTIFQFCLDLVGEVDEIVSTPEAAIKRPPSPIEAPENLLPSPTIVTPSQERENVIESSLRSAESKLNTSLLTTFAVFVGCASFYAFYHFGADTFI